jgi:energy-coupling factor transport system ATP-binding protein
VAGRPLRAAAAAGGATLLDARELEVTPPGADHPAVRGVSLAVREGEWLALAGDNGGGKTSLLLALAGLWPHSAGTLTLDGAPFGPGRRERSAGGIAVVLQDPGSQLLQPSVGEELAFTARNLGAPEDQVAREVSRWAAALGLEEDLALDPATLSAGRQQLVLLGAALAARPRLLLADEPTAHLDAAARARVRAIVRERVAAGLAVVWATQDPEELAEAGRTLRVGEGTFAPPAATGPGPRGRTGAAPASVLTLDVEPATPAEGPRVRAPGPLRIPLAPGRVCALLGPNGAGKSVLLAAAAGLVRVPQVRVRWETTPPRAPILTLQYPELQVFEDTVADELVFAAVARGLARDVALSAAVNGLRSLGFDAERTLARRTWTLSTGEKRLVEVIGALIAPAGLVLLDEPTGGVDPSRREALAGLVRGRGARDPVLVASQDTGWVERVGASVFQLGP